jgi:hypothetical protein
MAAQDAANFGSVTVGGSKTALVTFTVPSAGKMGIISVVTQGVEGLDFKNAGGGTCTTGTEYPAFATCTVNVSFKPRYGGTRYGAIVLLDWNGDMMATDYIYGTGQGPQSVFSPAPQITFSQFVFAFANAFAADENGNLYIVASPTGEGPSLAYKETLSGSTYTQSSGFGIDLYLPYSVAVDGAGNVYIGDGGNNRVLKETLLEGDYTQSVVASWSTDMGFVYHVTVDGEGNVYFVLASDQNAGVYKETLEGGTYTQSTIGNDLSIDLGGLAVDASSNVYILDSGNSRVLKEALTGGTYAQSTIISNLASPYGLALDGNGTFYILSYGDNRLLKETPSGNSYIQSKISIGGVFNASNPPNAIAVDGSVNLYFADYDNSVMLKEDFAEPPTLTFDATANGSTGADSPQTVTVSNVGNAPLNFSGVSYPADFPESSMGRNDCKSNTILTVGGSCALKIDFSPIEKISAGNSIPLSEGVKIITNTLNTASTQQVVTVDGTETLSATHVTPPVISPAAGTYTAAHQITISDATKGSTVYYTLDGATPTSNSLKYAAPFLASASETVKAVALFSGNVSSTVTAATYKFVGWPSGLAAPATAIGASTATLNAFVDLVGLTGEWFFQYGTTETALTNTTQPLRLNASTTPAQVSAKLTNLKPKTTYYYRVVVTTTGGTCAGEVLKFATD